MRTVYKFPLAGVLAGMPLSVPTVGKIVHAGPDPEGRLCVWVDHEIGAPLTTQIAIFGTGHPIPDNKWVHGTTFIDGPFVWHVYHKEIG